MRSLSLFLATGAYSGYAPVAPGTVGSIVGLPLVLFSDWVYGTSASLQLVMVLAFVGVAVRVAGVAERELGEHDSGKIVIDEIAGFLCATALIDLTALRLLVAFFLFRLFDILKPPPANYIDRHVPGGLGVVLDDVSAGIYVNLILRIFL